MVTGGEVAFVTGVVTGGHMGVVEVVTWGEVGVVIGREVALVTG